MAGWTNPHAEIPPRTEVPPHMRLPLVTDEASADDQTQQIHDMVSDIHEWLGEIMPAARVAVKMLNAREALTRRWRGAKG